MCTECCLTSNVVWFSCSGSVEDLGTCFPFWRNYLYCACLPAKGDICFLECSLVNLLVLDVISWECIFLSFQLRKWAISHQLHQRWDDVSAAAICCAWTIFFLSQHQDLHSFLFPLMNYKGCMLRRSATDPVVARGSRKQHWKRKTAEILLETEDFCSSTTCWKTPESHIWIIFERICFIWSIFYPLHTNNIK